MSKELDALKNLVNREIISKYKDRNIDFYWNDESSQDYRIIENALKDFEWLKSIIPIDAMFMWNLSADDKLRLLKIMGVNYEKIWGKVGLFKQEQRKYKKISLFIICVILLQVNKVAL